MKINLNVLDQKVMLETMVLPSIEDIKHQFKIGEKINLIVKQETKTMLSTLISIGSWTTKLDASVDGFNTRINTYGDLVFILSKKQGVKQYLDYLEQALPKAIELMKEKLKVEINQTDFNLYQHSRNSEAIILS